MAEQLIAGLAPAELAWWHKIQGAEYFQTTKAKSFTDAIRKHGRILTDAWLTDTGHTRPGMAKGLPLDEAKTQRLWQFGADGRNPRLVLENVKPVGYHLWVDVRTLALYVLGQPAQVHLPVSREQRRRRGDPEAAAKV